LTAGSFVGADAAWGPVADFCWSEVASYGFFAATTGFAVFCAALAVAARGFAAAFTGDYGFAAVSWFLFAAFFFLSLASVYWTTLAFNAAILSALSAGFVVAGSALFFLATNWRI
jgi:hypothetical protein